MKKNPCIFAFLWLFLLPWLCFSQTNPTIDRLKLELKKSDTQADSVRLLYELTSNLEWANNCKEAIQYGLKAFDLSKRISNPDLRAMAYDAAQIAFYYLGDREKTKALNETIIKICSRQEMSARLARSYYNLGYIAREEGDLTTAGILMQQAFSCYNSLKEYRLAFDCYWVLINANQKQYIDTLVNHISHYLATEKEDKTILLYDIEMARLYNAQQNRNKAMHYTQLSLELAEKTKSTRETIWAYNQIADYFSDIQHNYSLALVYYQKILELKRKDQYEDIGKEYANIGKMYLQLGNDSLALINFQKSLSTGQQRKQAYTIAKAYQQLGNLYYQKKHYQTALNYYLKCSKIGCEMCPPITFHNALIKSGDIYLFSNDLTNARLFYQKGMDLANSASDKQSQILSHQSFAGLYEKQGDMNQAVHHNQLAYQLAKEIDYLEGQQFNADRLSRLYNRQHRFREAYEYLSLSIMLADSIQQRNHVDNLAELETYFEFRNLETQKEFDKANAEKELARQRLMRNFIIVILLMAVATGILMYFSYRRKRKDNQLLREQKQAIEFISRQMHEADQAKLNFFTHISHELRTPLTLILGMSEKLDAEDIRTVSLIRKNAMKLSHLINQLLDLKKLDESKMKLRVGEGNVSIFLKGLIGSFDNFANRKNITIHFQSAESEIVGYYDPGKLENILSNLMSNAIKYNRENGWINVTLTKVKDSIRIEVTDNGIGIEKTELPHIFNRFYRITDNTAQGSGIGLALVRELVALHKGEITVNSTLNEGTRFVVTIPVDKQTYAKEEWSHSDDVNGYSDHIQYLDLPEKSMEPEIPDMPDPDKQTVLIVEDNDDLRNYLADLFSGKYQLILAQNGEEGFRLSQEFVPDIIISDIMMPRLSGTQLVEKVKESAATCHIPIILLTAKDDVASIISNLEKGADDYISKPFESAILKSRVDNMLRQRKRLVEKYTSQFQLQPKEITIEDADQQFLQKAIDIIEHHMSDSDLNIDILALEIGISRTQLYRKLKALTDYSANQFIRIIRLKRAAQIISQGQNNIAEVMYATGFSNYSHFNNCFRELFGESPKEYAADKQPYMKLLYKKF